MDGVKKYTDLCGQPKSPYLPDVGIIGLVSDFWGGPWMVRHYVLTRLAEYFYVIWVSPARPWRHIVFKDESNWKGEAPGFIYYDHLKWLPKVYRNRFLDSFIEKQRMRQVLRKLGERGCKKIVSYLWRPEFESSLNVSHPDLACYHIDDEYTFSNLEKPISDLETMVISRVDQVFIHSPALMEKKGGINPNTLYVPNGVDYKAYVTPREEPVDMKSIPHPRIGYVGVVKKQLDLPLMVALARNHREWSFVFVGPLLHLHGREHLIKELEEMPNVHFLGGKPVCDLPAYAQHMDVCMLCYDVNGYTKFIYPLKLQEYLASGRPVIGSPIATLRNYSHVIALAGTPGEWSSAITRALAPESVTVAKVEERRRIASAYAWDKLVYRIAEKMCERLGPEYSERLKGISPPFLSTADR